MGRHRNYRKWKRIIGLIGKGYSRKEIASEMGLSVRMVRCYIEELFRVNNLFGNADHNRAVILAFSGKLKKP